MYGFRKVVRGSESGCHMHPNFVKGKPENLTLMKRGEAPPPCSLYYQSRVYRTSSNLVEEQEDQSDGSLSEPEMVVVKRKKIGRKRRGELQPSLISPEINSTAATLHAKQGSKWLAIDGGTIGNPEEEMFLSKGEDQKRGRGKQSRIMIPVQANDGVQGGETKMVDGAMSAAVIEGRKSSGSGRTSSHLPFHKIFPPGRQTATTNSSGGHNPRSVISEYCRTRMPLQQQHVLGRARWNGLSRFIPAPRDPSYTKLLEQLRRIIEGSALRRKHESWRSSFKGSEGLNRQSYNSHHSSRSSSRFSTATTSNTLFDEMEMINSLRTELKLSLAPQLSTDESEYGTDKSASTYTSVQSNKSSKLLDLAEVAERLSLEKHFSRQLHGVNEVMENECLCNTEEAQPEQQQRLLQPVVPALNNNMLTADEVSRAEKQKPDLINPTALAIACSSLSKLKRQRSIYEQQYALNNTSTSAKGGKVGQVGNQPLRYHPSSSEDKYFQDSGTVVSADSRREASRSTTKSEHNNRSPGVLNSDRRSVLEHMENSMSSIHDEEDVSDVDMAPSILLRLRSSLDPDVQPEEVINNYQKK